MSALRLWLATALYQRLIAWAMSREPDLVVGEPERPYLLRWHLIPRNRWCNLYLHCFLRDDDDRALHDHPWCSAALLLWGGYREHRILAGGVHQRRDYYAGAVRLRSARHAHRLELLGGPCWTLFATGPVLREWGFHCPNGWVPHTHFIHPAAPGQVGAGCDGVPRKPRPFWRLRRGDA